MKPIVGYEGKYSITDDGRVWSHERKVTSWNGSFRIIKGKFMAPFKSKAGYLRVRLRDGNGNDKMYYVHRLVAQAFIPNPENKPQVNHINFDVSDNRVENLEWVTAKENVHHSYDNLHSLRESDGKFKTAGVDSVGDLDE